MPGPFWLDAPAHSKSGSGAVREVAKAKVNIQRQSSTAGRLAKLDPEVCGSSWSNSFAAQVRTNATEMQYTGESTWQQP
jgi:hypothetical protein